MAEPVSIEEALISIHALHGEGDGGQDRAEIVPRIISIHALHGEGDGRKNVY